MTPAIVTRAPAVGTLLAFVFVSAGCGYGKTGDDMLEIPQPTPAALSDPSPARELKRQRWRIDRFTLSPDGQKIGVQMSAEIFIYDLSTGKPLHGLLGHEDHIPALQFSPDGQILASAGAERTIRLWNVERGKLLRRIKTGAAFLAFSPNGKLLASIDGRTIRLLDIATGNELRQLTSEHWPHGKGKALAAKVKPGESPSPAQLEEIKNAPALRPEKTIPYAVAFSPDGKTLASGGNDGVLRLWDVETGKELQQFADAGVRWVAFSPDGKTVYSTAIKGIDAREVRTGKKLYTIETPPASRKSLALSPDGKLLAAAGAGDMIPEPPPPWIGLWDTKAGKELTRFRGHQMGVRQVAFSPDGKQLVSLAESLRFWDVTTLLKHKPAAAKEPSQPEKVKP